MRGSKEETLAHRACFLAAFPFVLSPAPLATATAKRHLWVTGSEDSRGEAVHGRGT